MTTNTARKNRPANCTICDFKLTKATRSTENPELCDVCWDQAGLENAHMDGWHDEGNADDDCPACGAPVGRAGLGIDLKPSTSTGPQKHRSHAECYANKAHDKSPAGRAGCRKFRALKDADA